MEYAFDDPVRQGVITGTSSLPSLPSLSFPPRSIMLTAVAVTWAAYGEVMELLLIAGTVLSVIPLLLSLGMPNYYLGDTQNAVDAVNLKGERVGVTPSSASERGERDSEAREEKGGEV